MDKITDSYSRIYL